MLRAGEREFSHGQDLGLVLLSERNGRRMEKKNAPMEGVGRKKKKKKKKNSNSNGEGILSFISPTRFIFNKMLLLLSS